MGCGRRYGRLYSTVQDGGDGGGNGCEGGRGRSRSRADATVVGRGSRRGDPVGRGERKPSEPLKKMNAVRRRIAAVLAIVRGTANRPNERTTFAQAVAATAAEMDGRTDGGREGGREGGTDGRTDTQELT